MTVTPAVELLLRGDPARRFRAVALVATLVLVGAAGTGLGVRLADGGDDVLAASVDDRSVGPPAPTWTDGVVLPIEYPVGQELPDLGETPGPVAAIWVIPRAGDAPPEVVGVAAETGKFGTLPIDLSLPDSAAPFATGVALSPDGYKVAYRSTTQELVIRDLASGESSSPMTGIETGDAFTWYDEVGLGYGGPGPEVVPLIGHVAGGTDDDGWRWDPGEAPQLINLSEHMWGPSTLLQPLGNRDIGVKRQGGGPRSCSPPTVANHHEQWDVAGLCDVLHLAEALPQGNRADTVWLGHRSYPTNNPSVVAVDVLWGHPGPYPGYEGVEPRLIVTAGAPERVTFATKLVGEALGAEAGSA